MIDSAQAQKIASSYLDQMQLDIKKRLQIVRVIEKSFGWIFFYQSTEYVETNDFRKMLAGNAPFVVDIRDGSLQVFGTAHPIDTYIEQYEASREN
jgi:Immunity protein 35